MRNNKVLLASLVVVLTLTSQTLAAVVVEPAVETKVEIAFEPADFGETRYEGWIHDRMQINVEKRLLTLDLDMILDSFVNRPGSHWWAGEHIGKYLHAASYAWRFTGDDRLMERMNYAANSLIATQLPNGYLGTYAEDQQFAEGDGLEWDGPVWDVWAHKYNIIGLLSYYQVTGDKKALQSAQRAADLMYEHFEHAERQPGPARLHPGNARPALR